MATNISGKANITIYTSGQSARQVELTRSSYRIGRQDDCEIVIHAEVVSREHATLELHGKDWVYTDLKSRNGTYLDRSKVERITLYDGINLQMGKNPKNGVSITFHSGTQPSSSPKPDSKETIVQPHESTTGLLQMSPLGSSNKQTQIIGRGSEADIQLPSPSASRRHASLQASQPEWLLNDLNSKNGTFLNGRRVTSPQRLKTGDVIQIASFRLVYEGHGKVARFAASKDIKLDDHKHNEIDNHTTHPSRTPNDLTQTLLQTHFGAYKNLELIGRGGMAEVYKSTNPSTGKPVAIKILPKAFAAETSYRQRFRREAQVVSQLEHPNIVRIFDSGEQDGQYYIVMEFLTGKDLGQMIQKDGKLPLAQALPLVQQIASALDYAHKKGFVHRDIKPGNVLLDSNGARAVLTDFGIAKVNNAHTVMTLTGDMLGTFDYVAPEQIQESSHVDGKADIYALGVMVYQMLTGQLPFKQDNASALLIAHLTQPPPNACKVLYGLPKHIGIAIQRAMAKKPEERFATATEFVFEIGKNERT